MERKKSVILIYTDGACSGNPGPGGYGYVVSDGLFVHEGGGFELATTNNRMEIKAAIHAINWVIRQVSGHEDFGLGAGGDGHRVKSLRIVLRSDSNYFIDGSTKWSPNWKKKNWIKADGQPVMNQDLWETVIEIFQEAKQAGIQIDLEKVEAHSGEPMNERVDEIAVSFSRSQNEDVKLYSGDLENFRKIHAKKFLQKYFRRHDVAVEGASGFAGAAGVAVNSVTVDDPIKFPVYVAYLPDSMMDKGVKIFTNWDSCKEYVAGKSRAQYRKVRNEAEYQAFVRTVSISE